MNEQIIVYAFLDENGIDQDFVTLDKVVAVNYAVDNDCDIVERIYEYSSTRSAVDSDINRIIDL